MKSCPELIGGTVASEPVEPTSKFVAPLSYIHRSIFSSIQSTDADGYRMLNPPSQNPSTPIHDQSCPPFASFLRPPKNPLTASPTHTTAAPPTTQPRTPPARSQSPAHSPPRRTKASFPDNPSSHATPLLSHHPTTQFSDTPYSSSPRSRPCSPGPGPRRADC